MHLKQPPVSAGKSMPGILVLASAVALEQGFVANSTWYVLLAITIPLLAACIFPARK